MKVNSEIRPPLIPFPRSYIPRKGKWMHKHVNISFKNISSLINYALKELRNILEENNFKIETESEKKKMGNISFFEGNYKEKKQKESYVLQITPNNINIYAKDEPGFYHAVQTLKQIIIFSKTANEEIKINCCEIQDWP